jgi:molybdate transport system substrate-binding protein
MAGVALDASRPFFSGIDMRSALAYTATMKPFLNRLATFAAVLVASLSLAAPARGENAPKPELLVLAAASLTNVLGELSTSWTQTSGVNVKLSFAASSVLARQIEAGGKADVFISADQEWMDYLAQRGLIEKSTRRNLVGNRLVLIAPADSPLELEIAPGFDLAGALKGGRLATGDPDTVPVGRYARSALVSLGIWDAMANRLVRADNVRGAMMFVSRGEVPLGIVYATDALADKKVRTIDTFPENTHAPITYPGATIKGARPEAANYVAFLGSADAAATWKKSGFLELKQ